MDQQSFQPLLSFVDLWLDQATYHPGEAAMLSLLVHNGEEQTRSVQVHVALFWLDREIALFDQQFEVLAGRQELNLRLALPAESFRGYGVDVTLCDKEDYPWAQRSIALDVLENWTQAPRYGFLSDFAPGAENVEGACASLARYHLNLAQFYDWMWRHYILMPPEEVFSDALKRSVSLRVVRDKVSACRRQGIATMGYAAVYAAEPEYAMEHPEEMLYDSEGKPYNLAELFYIMNIHEDNPWRTLILAEMVRAVREVPFDGLHLDQYGFPKGRVFGPAPQRVPYDLANDFPVFIDAAREAIRAARPDSRVIFNLVENWPLETVAPTSQDATYIEVWPPYTRYSDLQQLILEARRLAPEKQVILAAYMTPLKGAQGEELHLAEAATRLASAAIWANGGFHLLMGEQDGALCDPYYPLYASLRPEFANVMRSLYDFVVRYENTLSDPCLVTLRAEEVEARLQIQDYSASATGEAGTIWAIVRQMPRYMTLSLINLSGALDASWNAAKAPAQILRKVSIELCVSEEITGVYAASPDYDEGRPCPIAYRLCQRTGMNWLQMTLPILEYWSMVTIKISGGTHPA